MILSSIDELVISIGTGMFNRDILIDIYKGVYLQMGHV